MAAWADASGMSTPRPQRIQVSGRSGVTAAAPAKINLNLLVGPVRADGYHPLDSIVAKISLYDTLELQTRNDGRITLDCRGFEYGPPERNLAFRAARLLAEGRDVKGADMLLKKAIPPGMGLGGGSSDAAAALTGLNELWQLHLSESALHALACRLGSDVPLFLAPACVRMTGRGDILEPMAVHAFYVAIILPGFECSTPPVYAAYDRAASPIGPQVDFELLANRPPSAWRDRLTNDLAAPARAICTKLAELWDRVQAHSPAAIHLTGSGSGLFALFDSAADARAFREGLPEDLRAMCVLAENNPW